MVQRSLLDQLKANTAPGPLFEPATIGTQAPADPRVRLIAFYLPQFHPIAENDAWWGPGFTEWTNVARALPRFAGHVQPRLPADLGFYDLRSSHVMREQIDLARRYGLGGFCFHHYWFNGRRLLEKPLELLLADPSLDFPFCINWANENWTRRWDGHETDVLLGQAYSPEDDCEFARSLIPIVRDRRYIRIDGRPLIMIYRPGALPNPVATMRRWRTEFARAGEVDPYIVMAQAFDDRDPRLYGVDAAAEFPPHKLGGLRAINNRLDLFDPDYTGHVVDYADVVQAFTALQTPPYRMFRGVFPGWDNEARKPGRGYTVAGSTPSLYGAWLETACRCALAEAASADERIVFINAWNEWAEGAHLEPDRHYGHAYLAATARALRAIEDRPALPNSRVDRPIRLALISHDAHFHGAQMVALALARALVDQGVALTILLGGIGELTPRFAAIAPTETVPGDFNDVAAWHDVARRLVASGVTGVLCNTLVSARAIGSLRAAGLRVVQLVHELPSLIRQFGLETATRDCAEHAAAVVFPSNYVRDRFAEIAGPIRGRTLLRHQGLHMRRLSPTERETQRIATRRKFGVSGNQRMVLGMGYGDPRKGLDLWPALIGRVVAQYDDVVFVWIGRIHADLQRWLDHDLEAAGLQGRLITPGTMDDSASAYAAADAFVLTSREDPFPSVVIEAMASGVPTVVFENSGGIVDLVRGMGGITVPYLDVGAMGDAVAYLFQNPAAAAAMGAKLAAGIAADFDYVDYAADLIQLAAPRAPSVSVVVPNFNYGRHLRQRLESIWSQSVRVDQLIILDDASTDDSLSVIEELVRESPVPTQVIRNDVNSGSVSRQWARGVALAQCEVVWIAEADDFADPGFLAAVLPAFQDPQVVLSYCESRMVDEAGAVLAPDYRDYVADIDPVRWTSDFTVPGPDEVARALAVKNTVPNASAVVFRRQPLSAVLRDQLDAMAGCRNAADWLCYVHLLKEGGVVAFTAEAFNNHRRHAVSVTIAGSNRQHLEEIVRMQDLVAAAAPVTVATRNLAVRYRQAVAAQFGLDLPEVV